MDSFNDFLKTFSIKEIKGPKETSKIYWRGDEIGNHYRCTGLTKDAILWTIKRTWISRFARTYKDDNGKWWVGEKGLRRGFKTEEAARKYQSKLITKHEAK